MSSESADSLKKSASDIEETISQDVATYVISVVITLFIGLMYWILEGNMLKSANLVYDSVFKEKLQIGRFWVFLCMWGLLIVCNMTIQTLEFNNNDTLKQAKWTSIFYVGIMTVVFVIIEFIPGLIEIFENTFGASIIGLWDINTKVLSSFRSKAFPNARSSFDTLLPLFNLNNLDEAFDKIYYKTPPADNNDQTKEQYDFTLVDDAYCTADGTVDGRQMLKNDLFKLCFIKHNAGHFVWALLTSAVVILATTNRLA
jgi:hypothetical protein